MTRYDWVILHKLRGSFEVLFSDSLFYSTVGCMLVHCLSRIATRYFDRFTSCHSLRKPARGVHRALVLAFSLLVHLHLGKHGVWGSTSADTLYYHQEDRKHIPTNNTKIDSKDLFPLPCIFHISYSRMPTITNRVYTWEFAARTRTIPSPANNNTRARLARNCDGRVVRTY